MIATPVAWEAVQPDGMRRAMSRFATGVAVVTAARGRELHGMTVNSLTSVSLDPPLLLVCLMTDARTTRTITETGRFNVSILDREGEQTCRTFAERGTDHYQRLAYEVDPSGLPVLSGTVADLRCEVSAAHEHGDHVVIVGAVLARREASPSSEPLVFYGGRYHELRGASAPAPAILSQSEPLEWEWNASALSW
jgi:flavin reductase (DIM6/NTAB) family NADH-FMN oxidoreductase RutF